MMKMKKLAAALVALVMMITMMSCIAVNVSAESALGGPVAIEQVKVGLEVSGISLPNDCFVVSSAWNGLAAGKQVNVVLGGTTYKAFIGRNAFATIGEASDAAVNNITIYVTPGVYTGTVNLKATGLNIYGPYAGITPNKVADATNALDLAEPNPARPAANGVASLASEAVVKNSFVIFKPNARLTMDGLYFGGGSNLAISGAGDEGGQTRFGTYIRNSIIDSTAATVFNVGRGYNMDFLVENNRFLNAQGLVNVAGFGDITFRSNYCNNTGKAVYTHSLASASMGTPVNIKNNYWENSGTIFSFDPSDLNYPSAYSVSMTGNYVNNFTDGYIVENEYLALKSVPGININVVGNTFKGIKKTPFYFPYVKSVSNNTKARFLININENYFELPKSVGFIDSQVFAYLNCARNYYTSPMSENRVIKDAKSDFVYCPYYTDATMQTLAGGSEIKTVHLDAAQYGVVLNEAKKEIQIDFRGKGVDSYDFSDVLGVAQGSTWKMYETVTLEKEVKDKVVYFDGEETERYAAVSAADGSGTTIYRLYLLNDMGTESKLLKVNFDTIAVPAPVVTGTHYKYVLGADTAIFNCELEVSSGATYTLWEDSQCQTTPLSEKLGSFIPYSESADKGYTIYVKVVSEDKNSTSKYTLEFIRPRSENLDPGILSVKQPDNNAMVVNNDKFVYYYCDGFFTEQTFDFVVTPGANYAIYADKACTQKLSAPDALQALKLEEGRNTFYVQVKDQKGSNLYVLFVENGERSDKNAIIGVNGANSYSIVNGKIQAAGGVSDEVSIEFITDSIYATVSVYADEERTIPLSYTSSPVTTDNRVVDMRTFNLETKLPTSIYYVVCVAENGASNSYTLQLEKILFPGTFNDVKEGKWYTEYVNKVINSGMMVGSKVAVDETGKEIFAYRPNDNVTRQETAVIISRLVGYNPTAYSKVALPFADLNSIGSWARDYVKVCYYNGYMVGTSSTAFTPKANLTRQEMMSIIARIFELNGTTNLSSYTDADKIANWARADVEACVAAGVIVGENNKLKPTDKITRAQIATIMVQLEEKVGLYK